MTDFSLMQPIAAALAVAALAAVGLWLIELASRDRLMRCPETGGVALVDVDRSRTSEGKTTPAAVRGCDLWPQRRTCARGCLARYPATAPGPRLVLEALRPFERM